MTGVLRGEACHGLKAGLGRELKLPQKQANKPIHKKLLQKQAKQEKTKQTLLDTEPLGGDSDPPYPHLPVDPGRQCPGRAAPACSPCLLPVEGKPSLCGWYSILFCREGQALC